MSVSVSVGIFVWGLDFWEARRRFRVDCVAREERMVDIWRDLWDLRADTGSVSCCNRRRRVVFTLRLERFYFTVELRADRVF